MRVALALAFALFALALPAAAAETVPVASIETPSFAEVPAPEFLAKPPLIFYCWYIEGTTCGGVGSSTTCTDVCGYYYTCTCAQPWGGGSPVWQCPYTC